MKVDLLGADLPPDASLYVLINNHFILSGVPVFSQNTLEHYLAAYKPLKAQGLSDGAITNNLYTNRYKVDPSSVSLSQVGAFVTALSQIAKGNTPDPFETPSIGEVISSYSPAGIPWGTLAVYAALAGVAYVAVSSGARAFVSKHL